MEGNGEIDSEDEEIVVLAVDFLVLVLFAAEINLGTFYQGIHLRSAFLHIGDSLGLRT